MLGKNNEGKTSVENTHKSIKDMRSDEQPRERLMMHGPTNLADSELIAIILRSGTKGYSAIDISRDLISRYEKLSHLASCDYSEFKSLKGLGATKAVTLAAVFEIARRIQSEPHELNKTIKTPVEIANFYIPRLSGLKTETFRVLLMNSSNHIFRDVVVSNGSLNASVVHAREVFKLAISESAASIVLLHNHPSGNPEPSREDIEITKQLVQAGDIIGIKVIDHIIIAGKNFRSFAQMGLI